MADSGLVFKLVFKIFAYDSYVYARIANWARGQFQCGGAVDVSLAGAPAQSHHYFVLGRGK